MKYLLFSLTLCLSYPSMIGQNLTELLNLPYSDAKGDTLRQLNLILPAEIGLETPILLWIGGGAWANVNRHMEMDICRRIAEAGMAVASVGHRLSPALLSEPVRKEGVSHPTHVKDIATAFRWLHDHATEYGYRRDQIFVGGFSSGAHLSSLLAMDERYLQAHELTLADVAGVISIGGAFDIVHYRDVLVAANPDFLINHIQAVFGSSEEQQIDASPTQYVQYLQTPMLIMSDANTYKYNIVFEDLLKESEFDEFDVLHVGALSHGELWKNLAAPASMYRDIVTGFIRDNSTKDE